MRSLLIGILNKVGLYKKPPTSFKLPTPIQKQEFLKEYALKYDLQVLVETGTCFGDTIEALKNDFKKIFSIELSEKLFIDANEKFKECLHIELIHGDSGAEIKKIILKLKTPALFWLDAHYSGGALRGKVSARGEKNTPIIEELTHILASTIAGNVIVIDDARLFGTDPAYPTVEILKKIIIDMRGFLNIEFKNDAIIILP